MNRRPRILVSESDGYADREKLEALGDVVWADLSRPELLDTVRDADVLWVRLRHFIDGEVLDRAPRLRIVVTPTTGLTHFDMNAIQERGIEVLSLRDAGTEFLSSVRATAEHTIGITLSLLRNVPAAAEHVLAGGWDRDRYRGAELHGKTVGVVGYGRLGRIVARYFAAFDCAVVAADPYIDAEIVEPPARLVPLERLLELSEIVTLHVDLRPQSYRFFGANEFSRIRRGAWFINTSRGELVDEAALLAALRSGRLSGAALDVLSGEQEKGVERNALVDYAISQRNLLITPHIGGCTAESMRKTETHMIEKLRSALARVEVEVCR